MTHSYIYTHVYMNRTWLIHIYIHMYIWTGWWYVCDVTRFYIYVCTYVQICGICVTWLIHVYIYVYIYTLHGACVTWLIHVCDMAYIYICVHIQVQGRCVTQLYVWNDSLIRVKYLFYAWHDLCVCTGSGEVCDSFECIPQTWMSYFTRINESHTSLQMWLICMYEMTHLYVSHGVYAYRFEGAVWLIYMCEMSHLYVWHDTHIYTSSREMYDSFAGMSHIFTRYFTRINESFHTYKRVISHVSINHTHPWKFVSFACVK